IGRAVRDQPEENWDVMSFPAIADEEDALGRKPGEALWPQRYSREWLLKRKAAMNLRLWNALYQQRPTKHESIEWGPDHFDYPGFWFDEWPENMTVRGLSLDPSKGRTKHSDYSAYAMGGWSEDGTLWVEGDLQRRSPGKIVVDGIEHIRKFRPAG